MKKSEPARKGRLILLVHFILVLLEMARKGRDHEKDGDGPEEQAEGALKENHGGARRHDQGLAEAQLSNGAEDEPEDEGSRGESAFFQEVARDTEA